MEIFELPITVEESDNYRKFTNRLKVLGAVDWVKARSEEHTSELQSQR